jgi:hypothetical protein
MVARARIELRESEPEAELVAATYLAAGGVGTLAIRGATGGQLADLAAHGADTTLLPDDPELAPEETEVVLQPKPPWWPSIEGDAMALAFWRGGIAATRWMAAVANT